MNLEALTDKNKIYVFMNPIQDVIWNLLPFTGQIDNAIMADKRIMVLMIALFLRRQENDLMDFQMGI